MTNHNHDEKKKKELTETYSWESCRAHKMEIRQLRDRLDKGPVKRGIVPRRVSNMRPNIQRRQ